MVNPTSRVSIYCHGDGCPQGIGLPVSRIGDPQVYNQVYDFLEKHFDHGCFLLKIGDADSRIKIPVSGKRRLTGFDELKAKYCKWLTLGDDKVIDVVLGAVVANLLEGDTVSVQIVGPPSSAKTEILRALFGYSKVYPLSSLTPQTFISGLEEKDGK
jgi:hypothetical protein